MTAEFRALGLGPVAVLPDRQRSGVGSLLITQGLARAEAGRWEVVLVLAPRLTIGGSVSIRRSRAASPRLTQVHISWRWALRSRCRNYLARLTMLPRLPLWN